MTLDALARAIRVEPTLLEAAKVRRVTDADARALGFTHTGNLTGINFPYITPTTGQVHPGRVRRDHPEVDDAGKPIAKYVSCYGERPRLYFAPATTPLLEAPDVPVLVVESEKAALAITASAARVGRRVLAVATGGVYGGRGRIGKAAGVNGERVDVKGWSPDWALITWPTREVVICFDAGVATNPQLLTGRRQLAAHLQRCGARVRIVELPVEPGVNGPDDYLATHDDAAFWALVDAAGPVQPDDPADLLISCQLDIESLSPLPGAGELEGRLRRLAAWVRGADALRTRIVRDVLITHLKAAKVNGAAGLVDAALVPVATERGAALVVEDVPADHPVDGGALVEDLAAMARR